MDRLRALLIGCGRIGAFTPQRVREASPTHLLPYSHLDAMLACPEITVVGACDVNRDNLSRLTELYGISSTHTELSSALRRCSPHIVSVATRSDVRVELLDAALQHGVNGIYVEKPFSNSLVESGRILKEIEAQNVKLAYGTSRRYNAGFRYGRNLVRTGRFGGLKSVRTAFPDGLMMWAMPHMVDIALWMLEPPDRIVEAFATSSDLPKALGNYVEQDIFFSLASLRSAQGVECTICLANEASVTLICERATITCTNEGKQVYVEADDGSELTEPDHMMSPTQCGFHELAQAIIKNEPGPMVAGDILHGLEVLWMLGQSAVCGRTISYDALDRDLIFKGLHNGMPA
jgi:predicted dehydrogenase